MADANAALRAMGIEGALVLQMACTHSAAMTVLGKFGGGGTERNIVAKASAILCQSGPPFRALRQREEVEGGRDIPIEKEERLGPSGIRP